jgi:predicted nucleic acid-binding protein
VILVDSNVPMYLVGAEHPNKGRAQAVLEAAVAQGERLVTDAEVLQEILHRYVAIGRRDAIQPALEALLGVVDDVLPITLADTLRARDVVLAAFGLSARDAIHIAVMERHGIDGIMSFDSGFDAYPGVARRS